MACSETEDAGGLAPAKDDNEAARYFIRRTLPILDCVDYKPSRRDGNGKLLIGESYKTREGGWTYGGI